MTEPQPFTPDEPPPPARGQTLEERSQQVSAAGAGAGTDADETSAFKRGLQMLSPRFFFSMADGYPVVLKQFIQFCLLIIYPAWLFAVPFGLAVYYIGYAIIYPPLWLLFLPVRMWMKKNRPEEYEANRQKYKKRK